MALVEQTPTRDILEAWAAKAAVAGKFGKSVAELDDVEKMALIWQLLSRRMDRRASELTPVLQHLERMVRMIEADGFTVVITRTADEQSGEAKFTFAIDVQPAASRPG